MSESISSVAIGTIIDAVVKIITRHMQQSGELLSPEEVKAQIRLEIASGQGEIADWFSEHNLPQPE